MFFPLPNFRLECGIVLPDAQISYSTHGTLNSGGTNAILYPTQFGAQHPDIEWPIGPGQALDPIRYLIVVADQLGNGLSSSPSNAAPPFDRERFPTVTIRDNVAAQHRLLTEALGVRTLQLVVGFSMGAQQTYQWAVSHPEMVERIFPFCGTARTTPHNIVFLEGVRAALVADGEWMTGNYDVAPARGLRAMARVYAGWGFSQEFYNRKLYQGLGFQTLDECLKGYWEARYLKRDANNLLSMLRTWQLNDAGATPGFNGDVVQALQSIRAKATILASQTDLYFPPSDIEAESRHVPGARFQIIPSLWGHLAGAGLNPTDNHFITQEIKALLDH